MAFLELILDSKLSKGAQAPLDFIVTENDLHYFVSCSGKQIARIRKRQAYPKTYCHKLDKGTVTFGYGDLRLRDNDEFLSISLSCDGRVHIARDSYATLPIFYSHSDGVFALSNDYAFACKHTPQLTLSREGVLETLVLNSNSPKLMWNEIHSLGQLQQLWLKDGRLDVESVKGREWIVSRDAPQSDPYKFAQLFSTHLDAFTEKFSNSKAVFEISGGLDSATLPFYLAKKHGRQYLQGMTSGALVFPGEFGVTQRHKLRAVEAYTGLSIAHVALDVKRHGMLHHVLQRDGKSENFYCFQNPYREAQVPLLEVFSRAGADVVITGVGGDDCLENVVDIPECLEWGDAAYERRKNKEYLAYFTPEAIKDYIAMAPSSSDGVPPPLPYSIYDTPSSGYNPYIEAGMWPVSPFIDKYLYAFCQGMSAHYRVNKNVLRMYHQAFGFPDEIYATSQNENFSPFFGIVFMTDEYEELLRRYAQNSITAHMGYIDPDKLVKMYRTLKTDKQSGGSERGHLLYQMYIWLCLEINAQMAQQKAPSSGLRALQTV
jgi:hypothetical protein